MPFKRPTTTPTPDELYDEWLPILGDAELRALLYIVRRTLGFKKNADAISFKQFMEGIKTKDGHRLDGGCGIKNRTNLSRALAKLEERQLIRSHRMSSKEKGDLTTVYTLWFEGDPLGLGIINDPRSAPLTVVPAALSGTERAKDPASSETTGSSATGEYRSSTRVPGGEYRYSTRGGAGEYHSGTPRGAATVQGGVLPQHSQQTVEQQTVFDSMPPTPTSTSDSPATVARRKRGARMSRPLAEKEAKDTLPGEQGEETDAPHGNAAYLALVEAITRLAGQLGDEAPRSSVTRAYNMLHGADISADDFLRLMMEARDLTLQHQTAITRLQVANGARPRKNMTPYFFATLASLLDPGQQPTPRGATGLRPRTGSRSRVATMQNRGGSAALEREELPAVTEPHPVWRAVMEDLRETMTVDNYLSWFVPTRVLSQDGDLLRVEVKDSFAQRWIGERLRWQVEQTLVSVGSPQLRVEFVTAVDEGDRDSADVLE